MKKLSILNISSNTTLDFRSSDSDQEITGTDAMSVTAAEVMVKQQASNWLGVISTLEQTQLFQYKTMNIKQLYHQVLIGKMRLLNVFNLFFDLNVLDLAMQEITLNGNKQQIHNMPLTKDLESQTGNLQT